MARQIKRRLPDATSSPAGSAPMPGDSGNRSQPEIQRHSRWLTFSLCLLLALAVWAVFGQTLWFKFVNYDDNIYVYNNPTVTRGLNLHEILWIFTHDNGPDEWYPLTGISRMLDWQIYGSKAGGHHLTNVLIHTANVILLFLLLRKMTGATWRSAFVAMVFAIHPLRVESVAWVTERKDVLSGLFFMLTIWMWVRYARKRSDVGNRNFDASNAFLVLDPRRLNRDYYFALGFFILGLLSKSMLVTLPLVLLLLDYWPLKRFSSANPRVSRPFLQVGLNLLLEKAPFLLLSAAACVATALSQTDVVSSVQGLTIPWRIGNALLAYCDYVGHILYPVGLRLLYPHPPVHLSVWKVGLSALALLVTSAGVIAGRRKYPYLLVGWLWYLVMFLPVIDIMQARDQARADRYTYLPQIGLTILITWGVVELCGSWRYRRIALGSAAGAIVAVLLVGACVQTTYWKNSVSLWTRTLEYMPHSSIAHCDLGIALAGQGKLNAAVQQFDQALQHNPHDTKVLNNLGKVLTTQGKFNQAIQHLDQALRLNPNNAETLDNLGAALAAQGRLDAAIEDYKRALQLKPDYAEACYNLGNALANQGKFKAAVQYYERSLQLNPDFAEAHCNLGLVLARQGKLDEAIQHYRQALQLKPNYINARNNLEAVLAVQGKLGEAVQYYERALQLNPNNADALNNLGVVLAREGKLDEAIQHFDRALQLNPEDPSTHNNLGIALANQGKLDEAVQQFHQALNLAIARHNTTLIESIRARLKLYQPALGQPPSP